MSPLIQASPVPLSLANDIVIRVGRPLGVESTPQVVAEILSKKLATGAIGAAARRPRTGRVELRGTLAGDWQNRRSEVVVDLKRDMQRIESDERRVAALTQMRAILDRFGASPKTGLQAP